ncbi:MAG: hypothetical protein DRH24_19455 [Deltaproteobacteria bacterium]|nr:MAG: hypothetical protein DRH24_19455 [Deltaproteobacteria bacterium]
MKINQDYLKSLLNTFLESERPFAEIDDFQKMGLKIDDRFLFHMQILEDQKIIERFDKEQDIGLGYSIAGSGVFQWIGTPLRLTANGHEFTDALNKTEVWEFIKTEFKDASVGTLCRVGKEMLGAFAKKQIKKYLEE